MKSRILIILSIVVFLGGFFIFYQNRPAGQNTPSANQMGQQANSSQKWETKTDDQGQVSIKVTPQALNGSQWKFQIVFDTHSGSLDDDPLLVAVLVDGKGNTYQPTAWEGPGPGGHHREGILVFNDVVLESPYVELKVMEVGGITERLFKWSLE